MPSDLDLLIADLELFSTQEKMNDMLEYQIDGIIVSVLEEMGMDTIVDTGQARSIFVEIAMLFDRDISHILDTEYYEFWDMEERGIYDAFDSEVNTSDRTGRWVDIEIQDDGLYSQEYYGVDNTIKGTYPSKIHPRTESYAPRHLTTIIDMVDDGTLASFESAINKAIDKIANILGG